MTTTTTTPAARSSVLHDVAKFHETFGQPIRVIPSADIAPDLARLRVELLREEFNEYLVAVATGNIVEIADALGDMQYIINGTALTYGIDLNAVHAEIHRSNMSKLGPDGVVRRRADGKVLKPETYEPPMLADVLDEQDGTHLQPATKEDAA